MQIDASMHIGTSTQLDRHREFMKQQRTPARIEIGGLICEAPSGVYHPQDGSSTRMMLSCLPRVTGKRILELGTGTGAIGLSLAEPGLGNDVWLTDVTPEAVQAARMNAARNHRRVRALQADLFDHPRLPASFDVVLFNLPFWHKPIDEAIEVIACDPGGALFRRFMAQLPAWLAPDGVAYITYSNHTVVDLSQDAKRCGLVAALLHREGDEFERQVWRITRAQ